MNSENQLNENLNTDESDITESNLMEEINLLKKENYELTNKLKLLNEQYKYLEDELDDLQNEYSENIIIQSMNEMKIRYDNMIKTTVPVYKYNVLNEKYEKLVKNFAGCSVLIDHIVKLLRSIENETTLRNERKNILLKAELELITVKDILEDSLTIK